MSVLTYILVIVTFGPSPAGRVCVGGLVVSWCFVVGSNRANSISPRSALGVDGNDFSRFNEIVPARLFQPA